MPPARRNQGLVYRRGSRTSDNFTPRPDRDTSGSEGQAPGLSAFEPFQLGLGEKVQVVDLSLLPSSLQALADDPGAGGIPGHVSIAPVNERGEVDRAVLAEWASTRGTGQVHPLTAAVLEAVVEVRLGGKT
jgi:hypothetical protein